MDNKETREYYEEKELLTEKDAKKAKANGCPVCSTLEVIKKYVKDMDNVYKSIRTKSRCVMNTFYVSQAYPKEKSDKTPRVGLHVLEQSAFFNKGIISAMQKDSSMEGEDALSLVSLEQGKILAIQVEGEGIGKNRRTYTMDFKGKAGVIVFCEDGSNPLVKENANKRVTIPDDFQLYNLQEVEAVRFMSYQEVINQLKSIGTIKKIIDQIGYEIPGDNPSDNPLDDNYDKDFAKKTVGKPITNSKPKNALDSYQEYEKEEMKKIKLEDDDIPFEEDVEEEDAFTKAVPKSDPKLEVIKGGKTTKRKIF